MATTRAHAKPGLSWIIICWTVWKTRRGTTLLERHEDVGQGTAMEGTTMADEPDANVLKRLQDRRT